MLQYVAASPLISNPDAGAYSFKDTVMTSSAVMIMDMILAAISYGQLFHSGYMARGWNYILTLWYAYT